MTAAKARRLARRLYRLCVVGGTLDDARVRRVVSRAAASGRRGSSAVLHELLRFVRLDRDRHTALVASAEPLPADIQAQVAAGLASTYGAGVTASYAVDPTLIGGMRIKVGSDVFDGSVRSRLAALDARF